MFPYIPFGVVIKAYGPVKTYYNKFGEKIQNWDSYGKEHAFRSVETDELVFTAVGSDYAAAAQRLEEFISKGNVVTKTEIETGYNA